MVTYVISCFFINSIDVKELSSFEVENRLERNLLFFSIGRQLGQTIEKDRKIKGLLLAARIK